MVMDGVNRMYSMVMEGGDRMYRMVTEGGNRRYTMVTEGTVALVHSETAVEETYRAPLFSFFTIFSRFSLYNKEADMSVHK